MKKGHDRSGCWATNHADGHKLTCEKPAPVPEKYRKAISSIQVHAQSDSGYETQDPYDSHDAGDWEEAFWPTNHVTVLEAHQNVLTYWIDTSVLGQNGPLPDVAPSDEKAPAVTPLESLPVAVAPYTSTAYGTTEMEARSFEKV